MIGCFVTGTDTGVGKTLVAAALLHALAARHNRVVGMKPVAAGVVRMGDAWVSEDAHALRAASTCKVPPELDNPILLPDALSPHIAAERAGVRICVDHLVACYRELARRADAVVVEGAGGFHVPLSARTTGADLAQALALPVVLVVGLRLGCLNHAQLTSEAIRARGLALAGWVANRIEPKMQAQEENIVWLRRQLAAPLLADIAHQDALDARTLGVNLPAAWT
jgi:dethiobiotin synthetase